MECVGEWRVECVGVMGGGWSEDESILVMVFDGDNDGDDDARANITYSVKTNRR